MFIKFNGVKGRILKREQENPSILNLIYCYHWDLAPPRPLGFQFFIPFIVPDSFIFLNRYTYFKQTYLST